MTGSADSVQTLNCACPPGRWRKTTIHRATGREFIAAADHLIEALTAQPDLARPARFCPLVLHFTTERPLIAALQDRNDDLLGILANHPRSEATHNALGSGAVLYAILPAWRRNGLAPTDWALSDQALAMHALTTGFALVMTGRLPEPIDADPEQVFAAAVTALLGTVRH